MLKHLGCKTTITTDYMQFKSQDGEQQELHTYRHMHTHMQAHTHARTHAHTHTHMHAHTYTHTDTHTCNHQLPCVRHNPFDTVCCWAYAEAGGAGLQGGDADLPPAAGKQNTAEVWHLL